MANHNHIDQLESALQAVRIHNAVSYSWLGERVNTLSPELRKKIAPEVLRVHFLDSLKSNLYKNLYSKGVLTPIESALIGTKPLSSAEKVAFERELSDANNGLGFWEAGWMVRSIAGREVVVEKAERRFLVDGEKCWQPEGSRLEPGASIFIRMPKELVAISPGFYLALGNIPLYQDIDSTIVRLYWNLVPEGAVRFMHEVTSAFNETKLAFRLKVINHPVRFTRCDPVILYLKKDGFDSARQLLRKIYPMFLPYLKQERPLFTKPVAYGVGLAEDPAPGTSFGLHRCQILSEGMLRSYEQRKNTISGRLEIVRECFSENQISVKRPYLNPGSDDNYEPFRQPVSFPQVGTEKYAGVKGQSASRITTGPSQYLQTATEIGDILTRAAVWEGDRCSWMDIDTFISNPSSRNGRTLAYQALGSDVYSGTSGVALFLANLHNLVGNQELRRTSVGAISHALSLASKPPHIDHIGLYDGTAGVALVSVYIGKLLGEEQLVKMAENLLHDSLQRPREYRNLDVISGNAGVILALLALKEILNDQALLKIAQELGDELLEKATRHENQCAWEAVNYPKQRPLTGFSHGTAGFGYSLLELFRATQKRSYLTFAEMAFNYERHWFDKTAGNWPDFRGTPLRKKSGGGPLAFATTWCHGAPGIALSRLQAYKILKDDRYRSEAILALNTTRKWTDNMLKTAQSNFSLCHGLAGNAQILRFGSTTLGSDFADGHELAEEAAVFGINSYAQQNHHWPFGLRGESSPSLMVGLSGVGNFYLQLYDPTVFSFLLLDVHETVKQVSDS